MFDPLITALSEISDGKFMRHIQAKAGAAVRCAYPLEHFRRGKFTDLIHCESATVGNIIPKTPVGITKKKRKRQVETPDPSLSQQLTQNNLQYQRRDISARGTEKNLSFVGNQAL